MSRTIAELDLGTSIWIYEDSVPVEYVLIKKDSVSCVVIRKLCSQMKRMHSSNVAVYETSEVDTYLNNSTTGFLSRFETNIINSFVNRDILTMSFGDSSAHTISRKCYLLSWKEALNGSDFDGSNYYNYAYGAQSGSGIAIARDSNNSSAVSWWLRSPNSATNFRHVNTNGGVGNGNATYTSYWLRPALSVANATIVSSEGADIIYLIGQSVQYHEVDAKFNIGSCSSRPKKAKVFYDSVGLTDILIEVCNNYGDSNPTWVTATNGVVTLANTTKTTEQWQIGIRLYGKKDLEAGLPGGYFKEPVVLIETD